MPISLLLAETTKRRLQFLPVLDAWSQWLSLEETILARARGAFLVHWFGLQIPTEGLALSVYLANSADLRGQYLWARERVPRLNVFDPLMGWAGGVVGSLLGVFGALVSLFVPMSLAVLGVIAAVMIVLGGAALTPLANDPVLRGFYRVSGGISEVIAQLLEIWRWLTGPREHVRNPIIRMALDILDKLPLMTAHLVGFVSILLARVVPYIGRLAMVLPALFDLIQESVTFIKWVLGDVKDQLLALADGPRSPFGLLRRSIALLKSLPHIFKVRFKELFDTVTHGLTALVQAVTDALGPWLTQIADVLRVRIRDPIEAFVEATVLMVRRLGELFPESKSTPSKPSSLPSPLPDDAIVRSLIRPFVGDRPVLGPEMIPDLAAELRALRAAGVAPDLDEFFRGHLVVSSSGEIFTPFAATGEFGRRVAAINLTPPSAFARERRRLAEFAGGPPSEVLRELHEQDVSYRNLIGSIIDRMLPAAAAGYWEQLVPILDRVDRELFERHPAERRIVFPVLDLREEDRLRLEVGRFRLRYHGPAREALRDELRALGTEIRNTWIGQAYRIPAPA